MSELIEGKTEKEKPQFLYHASPSTEIRAFEPRAETIRDEKEGSVVFASPDKAYASMFIVPEVDDSWCQISIVDGVSRMVISDKERFEKLDKGGAVYSLPSETFETEPEKSLSGNEWTSKSSVMPVDKIVYQTGKQAMIENGVQIYFVDPQTFEKIKKAKGHGESIISRLTPEK